MDRRGLPGAPSRHVPGQQRREARRRPPGRRRQVRPGEEARWQVQRVGALPRLRWRFRNHPARGGHPWKTGSWNFGRTRTIRATRALFRQVENRRRARWSRSCTSSLACAQRGSRKWRRLSRSPMERSCPWSTIRCSSFNLKGQDLPCLDFAIPAMAGCISEQVPSSLGCCSNSCLPPRRDGNRLERRPVTSPVGRHNLRAVEPCGAPLDDDTIVCKTRCIRAPNLSCDRLDIERQHRECSREKRTPAHSLPLLRV